jgi:hypothetical protein
MSCCSSLSNAYLSTIRNTQLLPLDPHTLMKTMTLTSILRVAGLPILAAALLSIGLGASAHAAWLPMPSLLAASWVVSSGQSLQSQINAAAAGDNITVMSGTYNENITITNGLTIQGSGGIVAVTGALVASNAALPVYLSDIAFGGNVGTGITVNNCQNFRADRCNFVGVGNFNATNSTLYCYKDAFGSSVNFTSNTWTFQRCTVAGNLGSANSIVKFIGSTNSGNFTHNGGEITIFQSQLCGGNNYIYLNSTNNCWVCYNQIQYTTQIYGGNLQFIANRIRGYNNDNNYGPGLYIAAGCNATIRNNVFGRFWSGADDGFRINSDAGIVNVINNVFYDNYRNLAISGSPAGVTIRGNLFYSDNGTPTYFVNTGAAGVIIEKNCFANNNNGGGSVNGGSQVNNIFTNNPGFVDISYWHTNAFSLTAGSCCRNQGPTNDATYLNFDGSQNDIGAWGGHSFDPNGWYTTNPVVLSGTVSPTYVKQGQAVTISARAAVIAAP